MQSSNNALFLEYICVNQAFLFFLLMLRGLHVSYNFLREYYPWKKRHPPISIPVIIIVDM
jgi:hypothetical protein